jgi:hypothetical protein
LCAQKQCDPARKRIYLAAELKTIIVDLKMFIGNRLVDAIKITSTQLHKAGCIEHLKMEMEERNEDIIDLSNEEPEFFIDTVPSAMNINYRSLQ